MPDREQQVEGSAMGGIVATHSVGDRSRLIEPVGPALERASRASLTKQQKLDACVQAILLRPDLPAFAHQVAEVLSVASDEESSLDRLTHMVLRNYGLTSQLLRTANSFYYNRSNRSILSASHAIAYLGWNTIRDMAGGMLLFEHLQRHHHLPGLKELVLSSLLTANHAREISARLHYPRIEEAYLCGMFRNLGEVLAAAYLPDEYAAILRGLRERRPPDSIEVSRVLGFNFDELGMAILRYWSLPEKVGVAMVMPEAIAEAPDETGLLVVITGFSHMLSSAVYRGDPGQASQSTLQLLGKYGKLLKLNEESLGKVLKAAVQETRATFDAARIPVDHLRLERQIDVAMRLATEEPQAPEPQPAAPCEESSRGHEDDLDAMAARVQTVLASDEDFDLNDLLYTILEAIYRGGGYDRAVLALLTPDRALVEGKLGVGEGVDTLIDSFRFPVSIRSGPIGPAMIGRQNLFISTDSDGRYEKSPFHQITGATSFGLLPMVLDRLTIGCLYFDRLNPAPPPNEREKARLLVLRDSAVAAIRKKRSAG